MRIAAAGFALIAACGIMSADRSAMPVRLPALVVEPVFSIAEPTSSASALTHEDLVHETTQTIDNAFRLVGSTTTLALHAAPVHLPPGYAQTFGDSVARIPDQMRIEGPYQARNTEQILERLNFKPGAVDAVLDHLDQLGGRVIDELRQPDVVLRGFQSYRDTDAARDTP